MLADEGAFIGGVALTMTAITLLVGAVHWVDRGSNATHISRNMCWCHGITEQQHNNLLPLLLQQHALTAAGPTTRAVNAFCFFICCL